MKDYPRKLRSSRRNSGPHTDSSDLETADGQSAPSDSGDPDSSSLDDLTKSAYYNHKIEKQIITTESKHIYQRHQIECAQQDGEPPSPLARTNTLSSITEGDHLGRYRSESVASRTTGRNYDN